MSEQRQDNETNQNLREYADNEVAIHSLHKRLQEIQRGLDSLDLMGTFPADETRLHQCLISVPDEVLELLRRYVKLIEHRTHLQQYLRDNGYGELVGRRGLF